eukprot:TRINITY_DN26502_c0_g1_i1.p1 TRINITY_DN26502_c0_g1~~TRINITY_DN26502_c0_g1_i1.p1  ORF type:complete len:1088 (-),score=219.65 TRINITY_DN26502_c0_g1_i1:511-3774(-)
MVTMIQLLLPILWTSFLYLIRVEAAAPGSGATSLMHDSLVLDSPEADEEAPGRPRGVMRKERRQPEATVSDSMLSVDGDTQTEASSGLMGPQTGAATNKPTAQATSAMSMSVSAAGEVSAVAGEGKMPDNDIHDETPEMFQQKTGALLVNRKNSTIPVKEGSTYFTDHIDKRTRALKSSNTSTNSSNNSDDSASTTNSSSNNSDDSASTTNSSSSNSSDDSSSTTNSSSRSNNSDDASSTTNSSSNNNNNSDDSSSTASPKPKTIELHKEKKGEKSPEEAVMTGPKTPNTPLASGSSDKDSVKKEVIDKKEKKGGKKIENKTLSFDCDAGESNAKTGWSPAKQSWCCEHKLKGCDFDCKEGLSNWKNGWSEAKMKWCCQHMGVGCSFDCADATDGVGWSEMKRQWCCKHAGKCVHPKAKPVGKLSKKDDDDDSGAPPDDRGVDEPQNVALDSVTVEESRRFAEESIAAYRKEFCKSANDRVALKVLHATVQISEYILVVMKVKLPDGRVQAGIEVEWKQRRDDTPPEQEAALSRVQSELTTPLLNRDAELVLPTSACSLLTLERQSSLSEATDQEEVEVDNELRHMVTGHPGAMGIVVDKEIEAYENGLARQEAEAAAAEEEERKQVQQALSQDGTLLQIETAASYPKTGGFSWRTQSPKCLDYVHHQGTCGACYMFAALDSLADRHCINVGGKSSLGTTHHLSIQMALLCEPLGRQCSGGWADVGFNYSKFYGVGTDAAWPYDRTCLSNSVCQFGSQCFSPFKWQCSEFFTVEEMDQIQTFEHAKTVFKKRCEPLVRKDACQAWADKFFNMQGMVFVPSKAFCSKLRNEFERFSGGGKTTTTTAPVSLLETSEQEKWFFMDLFTSRRRRSSSSKKGTQTTKAVTTSSTTTMLPVKLAQCDRNRCAKEPSPHQLTSYNYLWNRHEDFKAELYNNGPFYTSFYVMEDFTWFFTSWPNDAYNYQWGKKQGGHAVVMVGWETDCTYHGARVTQSPPGIKRKKTSLAEEEEKVVVGDDAASKRNAPSTSDRRRRTAKGDCWVLRNTWGADWGEKGYFRMLDDMMTGEKAREKGWVHIASAAGKGPISVKSR